MSGASNAIEVLVHVDNLLRDATAAVHQAARTGDEVSPKLAAEVMQFLRHTSDVSETANRARRALEGAGL